MDVFCSKSIYLIQFSKGQIPSILTVVFGGDSFNDVTLECHSQGVVEATTFTFINPLDRSDMFDRSTRSQDPSFKFIIGPKNETVVTKWKTVWNLRGSLLQVCMYIRV